MPKKRAQQKTAAKTSRSASITTRKAAKKPATRPTARRPAARVTRTQQEPLEQLERLITMMLEKEVVEVEYEEAGTRWRVRRAEPHAVTYAHSAPLPVAVATAAPGAPTGGTEPAEPQGEVFKSPMVGTFYRAPSPEAEAFSKPGDKVSGDRTLCIIEAMKVMNEIKAEREFEIVDVLVKNGESVEFGQPLFSIR